MSACARRRTYDCAAARLMLQRLAIVLPTVAGALSAGGFFAIQRYTSHMTGFMSSASSALAEDSLPLVLVGLAAIIAFVGGAATASVMMQIGRRRHLQGRYAVPLLLEACLVTTFGAMGALADMRSSQVVATMTLLLLSFAMGLQNAVLRRIGHVAIRTTNMTGIVTDLGISLARLFDRVDVSNRTEVANALASRGAIRAYSRVLAMFFTGGLIGGSAFQSMGYCASAPIAMALLAVALPFVLADRRNRAI